MVKPYTAVGLIPTVRGIRKRSDIAANLEHITHMVKAAAWLSSLDLPVPAIALPEGALQGFNDEVLDLDHASFARDCAIDITRSRDRRPGCYPRATTTLYVMAQAKAHPSRLARSFLQCRFHPRSSR